MKKAALILIFALFTSPAFAAFHGNTKSKKFHVETCRWATCKACTKTFESIEEARKAGYVLCKRCEKSLAKKDK